MTAPVLPRSTALTEAGREWSAQLGLVEARALTAQIRASVEVLLPLIRTAYQRRADLALGYESWFAYCDAELSGLRLDVADRAVAVAGLRADGMSTRAIGAALGMSKSAVARELSTVPAGTVPDRITGVDGREQPATRPTSSPGPVDAAVTPPADPGAAPAPVELAPHRYVSGPRRKCSAPGCGRAPNAALHRSVNWLPRESPAPAERSHTTSSAVTQEPGPTPEPGGVDLSAAQPPGSGSAPAPAAEAPTPQEPAPASADRALLNLLSAPTDPSLSDATYVVRRDNPNERGLVVGFPDDLAWALIAWGEASKLTPQFAAAEAVREDVAGLVRWAPSGPGSDYIADPAERIAAVAEAAPEFVRPADPDWGTRFSTSIDTVAALVSTLDERYPSADLAAWATAEHQAEVHALLALVEAFAARVDAAVAA
jgi:hypothetical protein